MKISISYFQNIRHFQPNQIPVSTSVKWPFWIWSKTGINVGNCFIDKNGVFNGIIEWPICFPKELYESLTEQCSRGCPYEAGKCQFMVKYLEYLRTVNFQSIMNHFQYLGEYVRSLNHFEGEPEIVLMVYEHPRIKCAERPVLRQWFEENGYELPEWQVKKAEDIF